MPAGLPGDTPANNLLNPSAGATVNFDLLSGPKGSPFDNVVPSVHASTGALSTGIGFGCATKVPGIDTIPQNFTDNYTPGVTKPDGTASADSTLMYLGGGRSDPNSGGAATPNPYTAGFGIGNGGNGGSRDAGTGPAFTGFLSKLVTASGTVANGADIETGFANRSGVSLKVGQSQFGSSNAASAAVA
jgi:hypothetical protein